MTMDNGSMQHESLPLPQAAQYLLDECRMVLPGIQALFGFQLIAVFNPRFEEILTRGEQRLHLLAIGLVAVAVALIMTPAAYHRQTNPRMVSEMFLAISSRIMLWSMWPLAVGLVLEFYLIARIILHNALVPALAAVVLSAFLVLWFLLPRMPTLQRFVARRCHQHGPP